MLVCLTAVSIPANAATPTILILGDSLSAGYGIPADRQWAALLVNRLEDSKLSYQVVNASVSGITSADGLQMLPKLLDDNQPKIFILALGCNDGLRSNPIFTLKNNLSKMIEMVQDKKAKVLLVGFKLRPNYGIQYEQQFEQVFPDLSDEYKISLVPFLLEGFATDSSFFQQDQLHPTADAQPFMLDNVWKYLQPML
jgi:acyl-CoA thioesterase-1